MGYETLNFNALHKEKNIEIRLYDPFVLMKVSVRSRSGFNTLFNYISGNNAERKQISMTTPVFTDISEREYIAFTLPQIHIENPPKPNNNDIIEERFNQMKAVSISFKGTHHKAAEKLKELKTYIKNHNLTANGEPILLRYNGPLTPFFMRQNDIIIPIKE